MPCDPVQFVPSLTCCGQLSNRVSVSIRSALGCFPPFTSNGKDLPARVYLRRRIDATVTGLRNATWQFTDRFTVTGADLDSANYSFVDDPRRVNLQGLVDVTDYTVSENSISGHSSGNPLGVPTAATWSVTLLDPVNFWFDDAASACLSAIVGLPMPDNGQQNYSVTGDIVTKGSLQLTGFGAGAQIVARDIKNVSPLAGFYGPTTGEYGALVSRYFVRDFEAIKVFRIESQEQRKQKHIGEVLSPWPQRAGGNLGKLTQLESLGNLQTLAETVIPPSYLAPYGNSQSSNVGNFGRYFAWITSDSHLIT